MALEERLIDADVFQANGTVVKLHIDNPIDHQHGIAMRDHLQNALDLHGGGSGEPRLVGLNIHVTAIVVQNRDPKLNRKFWVLSHGS